MKAGWAVKAVTLAALAISGCSAFMAGIEDRTLAEEEIVAMSQAGVGSRVIIRKIEVTWSQFSLAAEDIIRLKGQGVSDDVIKAMIDSDEAAELVDLEKSYSQYDYWFNYYNTFYPAYIYSYPVRPYMNYMNGPYVSPMYRWSDRVGGYYRDFPVGFPGSNYRRYPFYYNYPAVRDE